MCYNVVKIILILFKKKLDMKPLKSKKLLAMIAMSITCACANTAYAEINERPKFDATYDDKVVLDSEWQIHPDEYTGAEKRKYTFNKGLTVSPNVSYTGNAIYLDRNIDVDFKLGNGSEMNLESSGGALEVDTHSKLTINGVNSNLYFGNKKWDEYNGAATIYMDEGSKLEINAGNITTSGGAETNLKLFDNAQAKINLTGNFTSDAGGTAIAMENDYRNSDTSLSIQAANITLGTTDLETAHRKAGLYLLAYNENGDNKLSVDLHAKDTLKISGFAKGIQTFGNALINLRGKTIIISAESDSQDRGLSLNSYDAAKPSILKAEAENLSIKGSDYAIYANDRVDAVDATQRLAFANWVEDDKLMQRMGDLRHETNNEEGIWVRVKGGKYSGDGFSNRHTMYQLGYDDVVKNTDKLKRYQGVAFSYDDGKNRFNRGSGKLKAKSIGFYSTDLRNKGHYLDLALKIYDADSDFTVFDSEGKKITGAFDNTGISLSAEYGRKKYLDEHWSIEPQAQLTLGYLDGARYTTSNGIHVSQSDPNSVLGRIGCNFTYDMDERNTVYLKVNWLHQFAGNYGVTLTDGNDSLRIDNHDHDTWFEYGLGFACMTGKNNYLYADVERSTGGSLRKNWQWNAGMSWTF